MPARARRVANPPQATSLPHKIPRATFILPPVRPAHIGNRLTIPGCGSDTSGYPTRFLAFLLLPVSLSALPLHFEPNRGQASAEALYLSRGASHTAFYTATGPVFNTGAQFFTGDSHAVQGDGEVNGTAIEASLTGTLQFIVHKGSGRGMKWPRAEDATHYYSMGLDLDLDRAMREATQQTVDFLREKKGLSTADAYALASIAVDFRVAEAVDAVQMIYGAIPKKIFKQNPEYWKR